MWAIFGISICLGVFWLQVKRLAAEADKKHTVVSKPTLDVGNCTTECPSETRKDKASRLYGEFILASVPTKKAQAAKILLDYKRSTRLSWASLGLTPDTGERIQFVLDQKVLNLP